MNKSKVAITVLSVALIAGTAFHIHERQEMNAAINKADNTISDLVKEAEEHQKEIDDLNSQMREWLEEAYKEGAHQADRSDYIHAIGKCQGWYRGQKAFRQCVSEQIGVAGDDDLDKLSRLGFKGYVFLEKTYKTRESAVSALKQSGWELEDAVEEEGALVWNANYPRTMKLVETKTGWAWIGEMADIKPWAKVKS